MQSPFMDIVKKTALFFAVGIALGALAPQIAGFIGAEALGKAAFNNAMATSTLWTGIFFGAFGAIDSALTPVFDYLFKDKKANAVAEEKSKSPRVALILRQPDMRIGKEVSCGCSKHAASIDAQRIAAALSETIQRQ
jgi:hypothetical protein